MYRTLFILGCAAAVPLHAQPVISEFMASNTSGLQDENDSRPDWIEVRNTAATPVDLSGWSLTDSAASPQKWIFPAVTLPANGFLVVFASGNDRRVPGQNLHTNFSLSSGGEYLALVRPDGSAATEFAPAYPPQFSNVSYGTSSNTADVTWVQQSTAVKAFVPADTSLIPVWRTIGFNDAAWTSGTFGVGYFNAGANPNLSADLGVNLSAGMSGTGRHSYSRAAFTVADRNAVVSVKLRMNYDDGFVAWINGTLAAWSTGAPTTDPISPTALVGQHNPGAFEDFTVPPAAVAALVNGTNVLAIEGMNTTTGSSDCFILPQLIGSLNNPGAGVTGYFTAATPGTVNGGVNTIRLPNDVTFSRPSGTYSADFSLTLGGALPGQEIRYTVSDPSGTGATLAEPTPASTLYTGPIPFTMTNGRIVRAAIFQGTQKSATATAQYLPLETGGTNNTSNFTSILPVIVLDDHGAGQPVDSGGNTYTTTMMYVFEPSAGTTRLADAGTGNGQPAVFSRSGTRVRGSSSAGFPKKSYGLETWNEQNGDRDQAILGLAEDSDWILNGPYTFDDTFIHNAYIYEISRRIGRWAPRTRAVEVFFNQNGGKLDYNDYAGVYILTEKIKSGKDRLDISGIEPGDNAGTALTGGYIFKIDRPDGGEFAWTINNAAWGLGTLPNQESGQSLVLVEPDPDFDTTQQQSYIQNTAILPWNNALFTERAASFSTRNYRNHIDVGAFVDHHLLNSLAFNVDALRLSAFYFKDREGKIEAGPIWDFDRALGSDDGRDSNPSSWNNIGYFFDRDWWNGLFRDPQFVQEVVDRWWELRQPGREFETTALHLLADQMGAEIGNAAGARDAAKWGAANSASGGVYLNEIGLMKTWLSSRGTFMDNAMPSPPAASVNSGTVAAGTSVTLSGTGTLRYTLNGTDPRPFGGATPGTGLTYSTPLVINATTVLTARRQITAVAPFPNGAASIQWSAPRRRVYLVNEFFTAAGDLSVSEVHFHPLGPTPAELALAPATTAVDYEWIELKNTGTRTVNTFEMRLPAGFPCEREVRLEPVTLAPGASCVIVKNRTAFLARYGAALAPKIAGEWVDGNMDDSGEEIRVISRDGAALAQFAYSDNAGWPDRADGKGASLEYTSTDFSTAGYQTAANWRSSSELHGSPGANGAGPDTRIVINEVLTHSNLPRVDAIELRNNSAAPVDVSGWVISDTGTAETAADYQKFTIPGGTVIPAGGYAVFTETQFNPNGAWNPFAGTPGANEFAFDGQHGDDAWLLSNTAGVLRFADHVDFNAALPDESWGRFPNGTGPLAPMLTRTLLNEASATTPRPGLGADNTAVRTGPLFIHEVHHAPAGGDTNLEFVEILNSSASPVTLTNWRLRGDVDYNFAGETIPAGGVLVVTPFTLSETAKVDAFRAAYNIDGGTALTGPWNGGDHLSTNGTVRLYRAGPPPAGEPGFIPLTLEDEVSYSGSTGGWPDTTGGQSLNRSVLENGSLPANWTAAAPTPGSTGGLTFATWKAQYFPGGGPGSGDHDDPDQDGLDNALEYAFQTLPLTVNDPAAVLPAVTSQPAGGGREFQFDYTRPLNVPGVTWTVQHSTDMATWTGAGDIQISVTATSETRRALITIPAGQGRVYLRLNVSIAP